MPIEVSRLLYLILPYVLCTTLAALIFWHEDIKSLVPKLIVYSVLASVVQDATYLISFEVIRFPLELIGDFLIALVVFRSSIKWVAKIYLTSYVFGLFSALLSPAVASLIYQDSFSSFVNSPTFWLTICLPINIFIIVIALLLRRIRISGRRFGEKIQKIINDNLYIIILVTIQFLIFISLESQLQFDISNKGNYVRTAAFNIALIITLIMSIFILVKFIRSERKKINLFYQESASENLLDMVVSIQGQRHDFLNHIQIISALSQQGEYSELKDYLATLLQEVAHHNEILKIDNPIVAALINAKISQANQKEIRIETDIQADLSNVQDISMELARILGNLIDNAMDAVEKNGVEKLINVEIYDKGPLLSCRVSNPCHEKVEDMGRLFDPGFTEKEGAHLGMGLSICMQLTKRLRGRMECSFDEDKKVITFTVFIPKPSLN